MRIEMVCPAQVGSTKGNRVTAERWAKFLRTLGHQVRITSDWSGKPCDLLIGLHAKKSHEALKSYRHAHPHAPLVLALTGTDLYRDLRRSARARQSLEWADRLIVLHPLASRSLPSHVQDKVRVIYQSLLPIQARPKRDRPEFVISVMGHLRYVKDPLRAFHALQLLSDYPQLRVRQMGEVLEDRYRLQAEAAMRRDRRYVWTGPLPRKKALVALAASDVMVISSRLEGGANAVSEAIVHGVPVLASYIDGNVGLLGEDYSGYFPVGDTKALADLMHQCVEEPTFLKRLRHACRARADLFRPTAERLAWRRLLQEFSLERSHGAH